MPLLGNLTNFFSDATKTFGFCISIRGIQGVFDRQPIRFSGIPVRMPVDGEYIRLLGRHVLLHVFHKQDLCKLMASCRRTVVPIFMGTLPAIRYTCTIPLPGVLSRGAPRCVHVSPVLCG